LLTRQTHTGCRKLELPMVLLDPRRIPQMVWIKLPIQVKVHILFHPIYSFRMACDLMIPLNCGFYQLLW
jgi:hypothetical protein